MLRPPKILFFTIVPLLPVKEAFLEIQSQFRQSYAGWLESNIEKIEATNSIKNEKGPTKDKLKLSFRFDLENDLKLRELEVRFSDWGKVFKTHPSLDKGVYWIDLDIRQIPYGFQTVQLRLKVEAPEAFTPFRGAQQNLEALETRILIINEESRDQVYRLQASVAGWLSESLDFKVVQVR